MDDIADSSAIPLAPAPKRFRFMVRATRQLAAAGVLRVKPHAFWFHCVSVWCVGFCTFFLGVLGACLVLFGFFNQVFVVIASRQLLAAGMPTIRPHALGVMVCLVGA